MNIHSKSDTIHRITLLATIIVLSMVAVSVAFTGAGAATVDSADREIDKTEVPNGSFVSVTVDASFDETTEAQINDQIDPNVSASNVEVTDNGGATLVEYQEDSGTISAIYSGVDSATLTYEIFIPEDASVGSSYDFSGGEVKDTTDETTSGIDGDETIEVIEGESDDDPPDDSDDGTSGIDSAERSIESSEALPGETVPVTTSVTFGASTSDARINDVIDPNVSAENIEVTDDDGATISSYQESSGTITGSWGGVDSITLEYDVTVPEDASAGDTYDFSGEAEDGDADDVSSITGNETIEVVENPLLEYADSKGKVGPGGLGDAAADFRDGEIKSGALGDVAAAFRSGDPVV